MVLDGTYSTPTVPLARIVFTIGKAQAVGVVVAIRAVAIADAAILCEIVKGETGIPDKQFVVGRHFLTLWPLPLHICGGTSRELYNKLTCLPSSRHSPLCAHL